jgi:hypothetical protein
MQEILDPQNVINVRKKVVEWMIDIENGIPDVKFDVTHGIGGGYDMK